MKTLLKILFVLIIFGAIGKVLQGEGNDHKSASTTDDASMDGSATYKFVAFCIDRANQGFELSYGQPLMEYLANSGSNMMATVIQSNGYKDYCTTGNGPQTIPKAELTAGYERIAERLDASGHGAMLMRPTAAPNSVFVVLVE